MSAKLNLGRTQVPAKQDVYLALNFRGVRVKNRSGIRSLLRVAALSFVLFQPFNEAFAFDPIEVMTDPISLHDGWHGVERRWVLSLKQEHFPYRGNGLDALFSLVSADSEPVSDKQPNAKREGADLGGDNWVHWWIMPVIWFFLGVWLGGGFGRDRSASREKQS